MKLGYVSGNTERDLRPGEMAQELESRKFESMWVGEHPQIPVASARDFPGGLADRLKRMWDPLLSLLAAAGASTDLRLGTGVVLPLEREIFTFAKQIATLDRLSGGRLILGVGVGFRPEFEVGVSIEWRDRYRALAEMFQALDALWNRDEAEFHGEFFDFDPVWSEPKPLQRPRPPILAATTGAMATRDCLRWADGWIPGDAALPDTAAAVTAARRAAEEAGRDAGGLDFTLMAWGDPSYDTLAAYRDLGVERVIVGGGSAQANDPSSTVSFLDRYAAMIDDLA